MKKRIIVLIIVIVITFVFPLVFWKLYDDRVQSERSFDLIEESYINEQQSLADRFEKIAKIMDEGKEPVAILLDGADDYSDEELCGFVNKELKEMDDLGLCSLYQKNEIGKASLKSCRKINIVAEYSSVVYHLQWRNDDLSKGPKFAADIIMDKATKKILYADYVAGDADLSSMRVFEIGNTEKLQEKWCEYLGFGAFSDNEVIAINDQFMKVYLIGDNYLNGQIGRVGFMLFEDIISYGKD